MFRLFRTKKKKGYSFSIREPRHLIVIPKVKDITKVDIKYDLLEPFVSVHIKWIPKEKKLRYEVIEPELSKKERGLMGEIEENLIDLIDIKISLVKNKNKAIDYIKELVGRVIKDMGLEIPQSSYEKIMYFIVRDFVGLNEIEAMMHDPHIEDIGCTGLNTPVYIVHRIFGSIETNLVFSNPDYLSNFVVKIAERCGRFISYAVPLLDGSLPDGSRVQASLAKDVTTKGPTFTIRKFRRNPYSPIDLINLGTSSTDIMAYLWLLVQHNVSILVCGGVSTGKTTFLNVLSMFIQPESKVISIEDTREINIIHENWIPAVARSGFGIPEPGGKKYGEINLFDLLKESFRQNPDYVIVGEVRGKEAYVMFQGMASGHSSIGTIHAGSVEDVIKRLETPPIELSPSLIESLDVIIVMTNAREKGKSARRIKNIVEMQSVDINTGRAHYINTFSWIPSGDSFRDNLQASEVLRRISFQEGVSYSDILKDLERRKSVLKWMKNHNITDFSNFSKLVSMYYKDQKRLMTWVKKDKTPFGKEDLKKIAKGVKRIKKPKTQGVVGEGIPRDSEKTAPTKPKATKGAKPKTAKGKKGTEKSRALKEMRIVLSKAKATGTKKS